MYVEHLGVEPQFPRLPPCRWPPKSFDFTLAAYYQPVPCHHLISNAGVKVLAGVPAEPEGQDLLGHRR